MNDKNKNDFDFTKMRRNTNDDTVVSVPKKEEKETKARQSINVDRRRVESQSSQNIRQTRSTNDNSQNGQRGYTLSKKEVEKINKKAMAKKQKQAKKEAKVKEKRRNKKQFNLEESNIPNAVKKLIKPFMFDEYEKRIFFKTLRYWLMVLVISAGLSWVLISSFNDIFAFVKPSKEVQIELSSEANYKQVSKVLEEKGVIDYTWLFNAYVKSKGAQEKIIGGSYTLNPTMGYQEIVREIKRSAKGDVVKFTIPEGFETRQIVERLVKLGLGTKEKFYDAINKHEFDYTFVKSLPKRDNRLEGYLYPDTYEVYKNAGEVSIINTLLSNFDKKVYKDSEIMNKVEDTGLTFDEVITLASIVEREGKKREELPKVASVFYNRLNGNRYPYLQSCATIQYVLEQRVERISAKEIAIDNKYNTYKYKGLPPGPIANPGLESIKATTNPDETDYYFFVAKGDGSHIFSNSFEEHQRAISEVGLDSQNGTGVVGE